MNREYQCPAWRSQCWIDCGMICWKCWFVQGMQQFECAHWKIQQHWLPWRLSWWVSLASFLSWLIVTWMKDMTQQRTLCVLVRTRWVCRTIWNFVVRCNNGLGSTNFFWFFLFIWFLNQQYLNRCFDWCPLWKQMCWLVIMVFFSVVVSMSHNWKKVLEHDLDEKKVKS